MPPAKATPDEPNRAKSSELFDRLQSLRSRPPGMRPAKHKDDQYEEIRHDLEVHQIELELQNQELKDSRSHLESALERYRSLYDIAPVGYVTLDRLGTIREINLTAADLLGAERGALVNRRLANWVERCDRANFYSHIKREEAEGESFAISLSLVRSDSRSVPVRMQSTFVRDELSDEMWLRTALTDLTELHRLVERLESERSLREQFVSGLTHDLRIPLAAAKLSAQLMIRETGAVSLQGKRAHRVVANIDRTERMISDLLDANRIQAGQGMSVKLEACNLVEMVKGALAELGGMHGERVQLSCTQNIEGFWDCRSLRRAVENLVSNAVKYGCPESPISLALKKQVGWVEISVHNQGNPISPEDQKTLFLQFRRTSSAADSGQKGWGIGLTLVRGIAEAHGGRITVSSDPENGTTFSMLLPLDARKLSA